jgi:hypothetical protein
LLYSPLAAPPPARLQCRVGVVAHHFLVSAPQPARRGGLSPSVPSYNKRVLSGFFNRHVASFPPCLRPLGCGHSLLSAFVPVFLSLPLSKTFQILTSPGPALLSRASAASDFFAFGLLSTALLSTVSRSAAPGPAAAPECGSRLARRFLP